MPKFALGNTIMRIDFGEGRAEPGGSLCVLLLRKG